MARIETFSEPLVDTAREPAPILVASERPAVDCFFARLSAGDDAPAFSIRRIDVTPAAVGRNPGWVRAVAAAVIDFGLDPRRAIDVSRELRKARRDLPILAVVCCSRALTPWTLRALSSAGVASIVDLQLSEEDALRALTRAAAGDAVIHLSFGGTHRATLRDIVAGRRLARDEDASVLELVALGLPDREIGRRIHLSPHTVKKRIEHLRAELGVRNRTELAAWAGRHGLYAIADERPTRS